MKCQNRFPGEKRKNIPVRLKLLASVLSVNKVIFSYVSVFIVIKGHSL